MSSKAQIFEALLVSQRSGGVTLAGGKVYFYVPGSETLKDIYQDRNKTTPAANPFTLSADGTAMLYGDGLYDVKVSDASNVQKFFWEDVLLLDGAPESQLYTSDYTSDLSATVAIIGSTAATLVVNNAQTVAANLTIPSTLSIQVVNPGMITVASGQTLTINGPFACGLFRCFSGAGSVVFGPGSVSEVYPTWWGANGIYNDGDDSAAFNAAFAALPAMGGVISIPAGSYNLNITPTKKNVHLKGAGVFATKLYNNTTVAGTYAISWDLGAEDNSALPSSINISDLTIVGNRTSGYNGLKVSNGKSGVVENIKLEDVDYGLMPSWCYGMEFKNIFFRTFNKGLISDSVAANNNTFENFTFYEGNADRTAQAIYDNNGLFGQNTFINFIMEGSGYQTYSVVNGGGNTFINLRMESVAATTDVAYIKIGGNDNLFISPMATCENDAEVMTSGYFFEISGANNEINRLQMATAKRLVYLTAASTNNRIRLDTNKSENQTISNLWYDRGANNLIEINEMDFTYNNEITWSAVPIQNNFLNSTSFASVTLDGLTQATVTGASSRIGPFKEGLLESFTSPTGNRRWYQDVILADGAPAANQIIAFSIWIKSLTPGGETMTFQMGRLASLSTVATLFIPDDKFVRVAVFQKADTSAYTDYHVGVTAAVGSSGFHTYGPQVVYSGVISGGILPALFPGGYVPTSTVYTREVAPNYSMNRKHAITPANGTGYAGMRIGNIKPAVGQPKGWLCTVTGSPGTWVSEGNL